MPRISQLPLLRSSSKEERALALAECAHPPAIPPCSSVGPAPARPLSLLERKTSLPSFLSRKSPPGQPRNTPAEQRKSPPVEQKLREGPPPLRPKSPHHLEWVRQLSLWQGAQAQQGDAQTQAQQAEVPRNGQVKAGHGKVRGGAQGSAQGVRKGDARKGQVFRRKQQAQQKASANAGSEDAPEPPIKNVWEAAEAGKLANWVDEADGGDGAGTERDGGDPLLENVIGAGTTRLSQQARQSAPTVSVSGVSVSDVCVSGASVASAGSTTDCDVTDTAVSQAPKITTTNGSATNAAATNGVAARARAGAAVASVSPTGAAATAAAAVARSFSAAASVSGDAATTAAAEARSSSSSAAATVVARSPNAPRYSRSGGHRRRFVRAATASSASMELRGQRSRLGSPKPCPDESLFPSRAHPTASAARSAAPSSEPSLLAAIATVRGGEQEREEERGIGTESQNLKIPQMLTWLLTWLQQQELTCHHQTR
ncbi:hypothetical protein CLOP_g9496 [Closterium sp. NIES-67]|nr:hypothetical protein CLOP_g9496 [Closterium sp. NIES-67]